MEQITVISAESGEEKSLFCVGWEPVAGVYVKRVGSIMIPNKSHKKGDKLKAPRGYKWEHDAFNRTFVPIEA
jgi:hypothetical protein